MKNLLFGAVMLMGTFAFANTGEVDESKIVETNTTVVVLDSAVATCYITINVLNKQGQIIQTHEFEHENVNSQVECDRLARLHAWLLS